MAFPAVTGDLGNLRSKHSHRQSPTGSADGRVRDVVEGRIDARVRRADDGGNMQVSRVTGSKDHCTVEEWQGRTAVRTVAKVQCFDGHGQPVNSAFTLQFVVALLV